MRVFEEVGYQLEGWMRHSAIKDGRVIDQTLYAILREAVRRIGSTSVGNG